MYKMLCWVVAAILLTGCMLQDEFDSVTPTLVAKGNLTGNANEQLSQQDFVITTSGEWNALLAKMDSANQTISSVVLEDSIDFNQYTVLAMFDKVRGNDVYTISIDIVENAKTVYVTVAYNNSGQGFAPPSNAISQSYLIVKIPKTTKNIVFNS